MFSTDAILQHRYRVIRPLGRGGMGAVYEAFDERLSRTVALKETLAETDELRRAFGREARLLANLRHPALPRVPDHFDEGIGGTELVQKIRKGQFDTSAVTMRDRASVRHMWESVLAA